MSDATLRERRELDPGTCCLDCGGDLRVVGEDVSELLDMIAAQMKVIQIAGIKKSCRRCEKMVQEPAPSRPIPGSMAGPKLLTHVLVSKFDDHLPPNRQHEIFTRMGADSPKSSLLGWCGRAMKTLSPLIERISADIMGSDLLYADDTPLRVLDRSRRDKGLGKGVKTGRIWAYVRDQRPWAGTSPPGAVYRFAPNCHAARQKLRQPKVTAFFAWSDQQLMRIPAKSDLAKAFRYGLSRQDAFSLFQSDGRVAIDNNAAERALCPIEIGRKNGLFAGADTGAQTLARIQDHKVNRLDELLPWNWVPQAAAHSEAA